MAERLSTIVGSLRGLLLGTSPRRPATAYAKTHLSALLDRVATGESITTTRHGVPAAMLIPIGHAAPRPSHADIVDATRALRKRVKPGKMSVREMVAEGRRF